MTKRGLERDLEELNEKVLRNLSAKRRFAYFLEALDRGREGWREKLVETTPKAAYQEFRGWALSLFFLADRAVYDLHIRCLEFHLVHQEAVYRNMTEAFDLPAEELSFPFLVSGTEAEPVKVLSDLYINYHAYRRFARQVVGVPFEKWLAVHPNGTEIVATSEELFDILSEMIEERNEELGGLTTNDVDLSIEGMPDEMPEMPLKQYALFEYSVIVNPFKEEVGADTLDIGYLNL